MDRRHEFILDSVSLKRIEYLLPRLKYSILPSKIIRWLENFEKDEVDLAIDLLMVYEYITFNELLSRLNELLGDILKNIHQDDKIINFSIW